MPHFADARTRPGFGGRSAAVAAAAALLAVLATPAQAAVVTWTLPAAISADADVSTNGTLVNAWNFGSAAATTVNGVLFQSVLIPDSDVSQHAFGPHQMSMAQQGALLRNSATGSSDADSFFQALGGSYQSLLSSAAGSQFGDRTTNLLLGGLSIGRAYQFQAWFNDSRTSGEFSYGLTIGDLSDNEVDLLPSTQVDPYDDYILGGTGQWVIGTFTADASTQALFFARGEVGGGLNGFQLRELQLTAQIPLPGTLALVGAALLAAGAAPRRRRQRG